MTIPTLVANYQAKSWSTASDLFQKRLTESLKVMNVQGKLGSYGGYKTTEDFIKEFQKHYKINKICDNDKLMQCFEDKITMNDTEIDMTKVKTADNIGQMKWGTNLVGVQFANGVIALMAYNPSCKSDPYNNKIDGSDCLAVIYDTSGFSSPNEYGKDLSLINIEKLLAMDFEFAPPVPCTRYASFARCTGDVVAEVNDVTVTDFTGLDEAQISEDGKTMTFEMAAKVCSSRGLRLPTPSEARSLYFGLSGSFQSQNYWVSEVSGSNSCSTTNIGSCTNCYMGGGNCGSKSATAFNYVRCVK